MSNIRTYRVNHAMQMISIPLHSTTNSYHLGNNDEVVDEYGYVSQVTNYYPFGAPYADASAVMNADLQQHKYNGKELDRMHGLNTYDYGARQHDPILARWDRIDPLCEKYYNVSPYNYCHNNPVMLVDPDGRADYKLNSEGHMYECTSLWNSFLSAIGYGKDRVISEKTGKELATFKEGTIQNIKHDKKQTSFEIADQKDAKKMYDVVTENTNVEWARIDHGDNKKTSSTFITNYSEDDCSSSVPIINSYSKKGEKITMTHNHFPLSSDVNNPAFFFDSGQRSNPSAEDKHLAGTFPKITFVLKDQYNKMYKCYDQKGVYKAFKY